MLSFFRISTAYKYAFWFLLLLALRLPIVLWGVPVLNPELKWVIVAEQMQRGFALYTDIWDNIPPLTALVNWLLYVVAGRNFFVSHIFVTFLIAVQAIVFNQILQSRQVFNEKTLLPALLYGAFMSLFLDFYVLSAPLLANTFLMIALGYIFAHLSEKRRINAVFETGAYTGIATLFYFPSFTFLLVPTFAFMLYTPTAAKDYLLMYVAFFFTIGIAFLAFFLTGSEYDFWVCFFASHLQPHTYQYMDLVELLVLITPLVLLMLFFVGQSRSYRNYTNYQDRCQNVLFWWFWVGLFNVVLSRELSAFSFMPMLLAFVGTFTHFGLQFQVRWITELIFLVLVGAYLFFTYTTQHRQEIRLKIPFVEWANWRLTLPAQRLIAESTPENKALKGRKVWVSGFGLGTYLYAKPATPYLHRALADRHLAHLKEYNTLAAIYHNFERDLPEVLIDQDGKATEMLDKLPLLAEKYTLRPQGKLKIYMLKKSR